MKDDILGLDINPRSAIFDDYIKIGVRNNLKRAHLFVSTVLAKHIPVRPHKVEASTRMLAAKITTLLDSLNEPKDSAVVVGYAETAVGLGIGVAEHLELPVTHSTRFYGDAYYAAFDEVHSHAPSHAIIPNLGGYRTIILVDDELSTGNTVLNTIATLEEKAHHDLYVVASLLDTRTAEHQQRCARFAADHGVRIEFTASILTEVTVPEDVQEKARRFIAVAEPGDMTCWEPGQFVYGHSTAPSASYASTPHVPAESEAAYKVATDIMPHVNGSTLVLGVEEYMYFPQKIARELQKAGADVLVSSTTRSPIVVHNSETYPVGNAVAYQHPSADGTTARFAYNVQGFDTIIVVIDPTVDEDGIVSDGGLIDRLQHEIDADIMLLVLEGANAQRNAA